MMEVTVDGRARLDLFQLRHAFQDHGKDVGSLS